MSKAPTLQDTAIAFLHAVSSGDTRAAFEQYVAPAFRHHNPYFKGDAESLRRGMQDNADQFPGKALSVLRAMQDGQMVAVHSHVRHTEDEPGFMLMHWFRFEGERIAEAWDLAQPIPQSSPNEYGMF